MTKSKVIHELKEIKKELASLKKNMVDKDMVINEEDFKALCEAAKEKKKGKLISLEEIEKELGCF